MIVENINEFEIKLLFPEDQLESIEKLIISNGGIRRQHLQAAYIDTPDFVLTRSGFAFRLRKEGRQWIQTLKASTPNPLERLEHNVTLSAVGKEMPEWNLDLHQNHKAGQLLRKKCPNLKPDDLRVSYQTDIWRRKALINTQLGSLEYALDSGFIYSQLNDRVSSIKVLELEIELKAGEPLDVLSHAKNLIKNHGAYIDTRSKSERGFLLANGLQASPAMRAKAISLNKAKNAQEIIACLIDSCLQQVLTNQSALNAGLDQYSEYLHQLRVGLRRLKVLFKYLARHDIHLGDEELEAFKRAFDQLGGYRDGDYVTGTLNPILLSLGGPEIRLASIKDLPNPCFITKNSEFQLLLVDVMSISYLGASISTDPEDRKGDKEEVRLVRKTINKLLDGGFSFVADRASRFSELQDDQIHSVRKKMKFLRYSLEFFRDYCNKSKYAKFNKSIADALEYFGLFNDMCVAISRIEALTQDDPNVLFALGWLKAERQRVRSLCGKSLKKLVRMDPAWGA